MFDPASSVLGQMLLEEITPVVMVLRTPLVEESCLKNGLNFVQMLKPFCLFNNIDGNHQSLSLFVFVFVFFDYWPLLLRLSCLYWISFVLVPVRTVSDQPYRLHRFKLRLYYASDVRQPNVEVILISNINPYSECVLFRHL